MTHVSSNSTAISLVQLRERLSASANEAHEVFLLTKTCLSTAEIGYFLPLDENEEKNYAEKLKVLLSNLDKIVSSADEEVYRKSIEETKVTRLKELQYKHAAYTTSKTKLNNLISGPETKDLNFLRQYNKELTVLRNNLAAHKKSLRSCDLNAEDSLLKVSICEQAIAATHKEIKVVQSKITAICTAAKERKEVTVNWREEFETQHHVVKMELDQLEQEFPLLRREEKPTSEVVMVT